MTAILDLREDEIRNIGARDRGEATKPFVSVTTPQADVRMLLPVMVESPSETRGLRAA